MRAFLRLADTSRVWHGGWPLTGDGPALGAAPAGHTYPSVVNYIRVVPQPTRSSRARPLVGAAGDSYRGQVVDTNEYSLEPPDVLASRLRAYRLKHGVTQRELADQLAVTQQSVARWEQGSPPRRHMVRVIESLLAGDDGSEPSTDLADIIGIRPPALQRVQAHDIEGARKVYVQGCLKLLERGERLPNRVLLLLADELGWGEDDR